MAKSELIESADFSYSMVDKDEAAKLRYCAAEIHKKKGTVAVSMMEIGEMLSIAHEQLAAYGAGTFQKWVESECGFSKKTAYNYMAAFNVFGNCETVAQLEDSAMYALAQNGTPEKARKEVLKLADKGTKITQKLAKEIIKKHMEQAEQDQDSAHEEEVEEEPIKPPPPPSKEEQMKAERDKAKSYAAYLMRSIDDLNRIKRNTVVHPKLIELCGQIIKGLERW